MNSTVRICPICDEGTLRTSTHALDVNHRGQTIRVDGLVHSVCSECGADPVLPDQARRNHTIIADARRATEGLLTSTQIRAIRTKLSLSQARASELFGGGANAFSKYERGEVAQSVPMDRLLRVANTFPWVLEFLTVIQEPQEAGALERRNELWVSRQKVTGGDELRKLTEISSVMRGGTVIDFQAYHRRAA
jgi:HTH-type transcriptional regulator / antitoxin MqsA